MPSVGGGQTPPIPNPTLVHNHNAQNSTQARQRKEISDLYLLVRAGRPPQYVTFPLNDLSVPGFIHKTAPKNAWECPTSNQSPPKNMSPSPSTTSTSKSLRLSTATPLLRLLQYLPDYCNVRLLLPDYSPTAPPRLLLPDYSSPTTLHVNSSTPTTATISDFSTLPLCEKTAARVLVEFLLCCCYVRHAHTMPSKTVWRPVHSVGLERNTCLLSTV